MHHLLESIGKIVFPENCIICEDRLGIFEYEICKKCLEKLYSEFHVIKSSSYYSNHYYFSLFDNYIQKLIHELKYEERKKIGAYIGRHFGSVLMQRKELDLDAYDFITPIPLHPVKKYDREYNQAYEIASGISNVTGLKLKKLLKRTKYTKSQTKLNKSQRIGNVSGCFRAINKKHIKSKNILLLDDVLTTGATMNECAKVLLCSGAAKVSAITICQAEKPGN